MNSKRSYREALPKHSIVAEIKSVSGTQLEPKVVTAFFEALEEHPDFWERES